MPLLSQYTFLTPPGVSAKPNPTVTLTTDTTSADHNVKRAQYEAMLQQAIAAGYNYKTSCNERVSYDELGREYFVYTYVYTIEGPVNLSGA